MRVETVNGIPVATDEPPVCRVCGGPRTDDAYERQTGCDTCGYVESDCICCPDCGGRGETLHTGTADNMDVEVDVCRTCSGTGVALRGEDA